MIAILGAGKRGQALLSGLLVGGRAPSVAGRVVRRAGAAAAVRPAYGGPAPSDGAVVVRRAERAAELSTTYGVPVLSAEEAAKNASTLVITVKPQDMARMLGEIAAFVDPSQLVISVAAGITTSFI